MSASARIFSLYSAVKVRGRASAITSGSGRGGLGGSGATVLPAAVLRSVSLRSSSLRSAAGKTVGEAEEVPLFFTLIPVLALLSNYDRKNCLINVGTEGSHMTVAHDDPDRVRAGFQSPAQLVAEQSLLEGAGFIFVNANRCG